MTKSDLIRLKLLLMPEDKLRNAMDRAVADATALVEKIFEKVPGPKPNVYPDGPLSVVVVDGDAPPKVLYDSAADDASDLADYQARKDEPVVGLSAGQSGVQSSSTESDAATCPGLAAVIPPIPKKRRRKAVASDR